MRTSYKVDFPPEWNKRKKAGLCPVCAKPKEEFEKGRQIYCSAACADKYSDHFITWQALRQKIIDKHPKCEECGTTEENWRERRAEKEAIALKEFEVKYEREITAIRIHALTELENNFIERIKEIESKGCTWFEIRNGLERIGISVPFERYTFPGFEVDHRVAIMNGGDQWDEANLRVLCHDCHLKKTRHDHSKAKETKENAKANAGDLYK
jgi:rubredoxin